VSDAKYAALVYRAWKLRRVACFAFRTCFINNASQTLKLLIEERSWRKNKVRSARSAAQEHGFRFKNRVLLAASLLPQNKRVAKICSSSWGAEVSGAESRQCSTDASERRSTFWRLPLIPAWFLVLSSWLFSLGSWLICMQSAMAASRRRRPRKYV